MKPEVKKIIAKFDKALKRHILLVAKSGRPTWSGAYKSRITQLQRLMADAVKKSGILLRQRWQLRGIPYGTARAGLSCTFEKRRKPALPRMILNKTAFLRQTGMWPPTCKLEAGVSLMLYTSQIVLRFTDWKRAKQYIRKHGLKVSKAPYERILKAELAKSQGRLERLNEFFRKSK